MGEQADRLSELVGFFNNEVCGTGAFVEGSNDGKCCAILDFSKARMFHLKWVRDVRQFLDSTKGLDINKIASHHDCILGQWLDEHGMETYGHHPQMKVLFDDHETMHDLLKVIIRYKNYFNNSEAEHEFQNLIKLSGTIVDHLDFIEQQICAAKEAA